MTKRQIRSTLALRAAILSVYALAACSPKDTTTSESVELAPAPPKTEMPRLEVAPLLIEPPLTRRELIEYAAAAAAAFSDGSDSADQKKLENRKFALRLPFNCGGLNSPAKQAYAQKDDRRNTLKLVARPTDWTNSDFRDEWPPDTETVEGFWIPRPWRYSDACPAQTQPSAAVSENAEPPIAPPTLGLASAFEKGGSRLLRRDSRAYEFVFNLTANDQADEPYFLSLEGRLTQFRNGKPIACSTVDPDHPPVCLYAVQFSRVAFENTSGETLAEWKN